MKKSNLSRCFISFIILSISFAAISAQTYQPPCDGDMDLVYDPCGGSCERTCENIADPNWSCTPNCTVGGCRCAKGLVRNYGWICVKPEDCNVQCPEGEAYSNCGANECQNTCSDFMKMTKCTAACTPGCVCVLGYVRDENGVCIPAETCGVSCGGDKNAFTTTCGNDCSRRTCAVLNDEPFFCSTECSGIEECNCKPGYVIHEGKCVPISTCPACAGENESYLCRPCDLDCGNLEEKCDATKPCKNGCFCNIGYARNYKGVCVRLDTCPQKSCGGDANAIYDQCDAHCPKTCEMKDGDPNCIRGCLRKGDCVCREGFVRNSAGKCIAPEECSLMQRSNLRANRAICLENEIYVDNANCKPTCSVPEVDPNCSPKPGCACQVGFMKNSAGTCVPCDKCDSPCGGDYDKIFDVCGNSCQRTCENINDKDWTCTPKCTQNGACKCNNGLVLNNAGFCVLPKDCSQKCPEGEAYSQSGNHNCQNTCENPKKFQSCFPIAKPGCICIEGYMRDSNGVCIPADQCGISCGGDSNSVSSTCATPCSFRNCASINDEPLMCAQVCNGIETCICKSGYVTRDGKCTPISQCPKCDGANESLLVRPCDLNCYSLDEKCDSLKSCKEGCFCNIGFARDHKNICVRLPKCPQKQCNGDPNAIFDQIGLNCMKTCDEKEGNPNCIPIAMRSGGCSCREGFVKNYDGKCIPPQECCLSPKSNGPRPPSFPQFNPAATSQNKLVSYPSDHPMPLTISGTTTTKPVYMTYPTIPPTATTTVAPIITTTRMTTRAPIYTTTPATTTTTTEAPTTTTKRTKRKTTPKPPEPESSESTVGCGQNEMLEQFPMKCTPSVQTCEMYFKGEQPMCMMDMQNCKPECRCMGGYVRNKNWKCVTPQDCCDDPNSEMRAGANQCPGGTCSHPEFEFCNAPWVPFGCQCKMGYLKKSDTDSTCVPVSECHKYKTCD